MAQWVTGQLNNVYSMKDPSTAKHALLQVILAIKDATSLPWGAVRSAWATSVHDLEEGNLHWNDATQWAINHLSASQMSMAILNSHSSIIQRSFVNFIMRGLAPTKIIMGHTDISAATVRGWGGYSSTQRSNVTRKTNLKTDRQ